MFHVCNFMIDANIGDAFVIKDSEGREHKRLTIDHDIAARKVINLSLV